MYMEDYGSNVMMDYMEAMENWAEARDAYHRAERAYDGPSPDWALGREREKMVNATKALNVCFINAVRTAIDTRESVE